MLNEKISFSKKNLDLYLRELAKEFLKKNGKYMKAEIILTGGAAIVANYGFREMTYDIDAIILASSAMKDVISTVGNKFDLPAGWMNNDFMRTRSYSSKLVECSVYYKTFSNILTVRTIGGEYLIAMKLVSGRKYKNDLSDITGILMSHEKKKDPITMDRIGHAVEKLYGSWEIVSEDMKEFITKLINNKSYLEAYSYIRNEESDNKDILMEIQQENPKAVNEKNINEILSVAREKLKKS